MISILLVYILPLIIAIWLTKLFTKLPFKALLTSKQQGNYKLYFTCIFNCIVAVGIATILFGGLLGLPVFAKGGFNYLSLNEALVRGGILLGLAIFFYIMGKLFYKW